MATRRTAGTARKAKKGKGDGKNGKKGGKGPNQSQNPARWGERPLECGMLVEPTEPVRLPRRATKGRQRKMKERHRQRSGLSGTKETKLQLWNNSRNRLLRAHWTWRRLRNLEGHLWMSKVGWDGHTTLLRRFRPFHWMQRLAHKRRRMSVATKLLQGGTHPRPWRLVRAGNDSMWVCSDYARQESRCSQNSDFRKKSSQ